MESQKTKASKKKDSTNSVDLKKEVSKTKKVSSSCKKIEDCRKWVNNINSIEQMEEIFKVCGKITTGNKFSIATFPNSEYYVAWTTISFGKTYPNGCLYMMRDRELVYIASLEKGGKMDEDVVDFILDDLLNFDTDGFYRFYFKKYGYESILEEVKSETVMEIFEVFIERHCIMNNIFTTSDYNSVTISGTKRNGTDFEHRVTGCNKDDIIELTNLTRIKPHVNKKSSIDFYERPHNLYSTVSDKAVMEAYNDYKDSCSYD